MRDVLGLLGVALVFFYRATENTTLAYNFMIRERSVVDPRLFSVETWLGEKHFGA